MSFFGFFEDVEPETYGAVKMGEEWGSMDPMEAARWEVRDMKLKGFVPKDPPWTIETEEEKEAYAIRLDGEKEKFETRIGVPAYKTRSDRFDLVGLVPEKEFPGNPTWVKVEHRRLGGKYTMKCWLKEESLAECNLEQKLMSSVDSDFIDTLWWVCSTQFYEITIQDHFKYGPLSRVIGHKLSWFKFVGQIPETSARILIAQLILGLEYLHKVGYLHLNLSSDNIMICDNRHVKISGLGMAKKLDDLEKLDEAEKAEEAKKADEAKKPKKKRDTFAGNILVTAPEIHKKEAYGAGADWWSLGIVAFEIFYGKHPFADPGWPKERQIKFIINQPLKFPDQKSASISARRLMSGLLDRRLNRRVGAGAGGAEDVKDIPWFDDISFAKVYCGRYDVVYEIEPLKMLPLEKGLQLRPADEL